MGRSRICPACSLAVSNDESFEYKGRYYHEKCFTKFSKQETKEKVKQKKQKKQVEQAKKDVQKDTHISIEVDISDDEILAKEKVVNYLKRLTNTDKLDVKTYKLLKDYYSTYKFSYEGMLIALKYFYDTQDNPPVSDCVGIIPYIYSEAQEYEKTKAAVVDQVSKLDMTTITTERIVRINKRNDEEKDKLIDIGELR